MATLLWDIFDSVTGQEFVVDSPTQPSTTPLGNPTDPTKTRLLNCIERQLADGRIGLVAVDASGSLVPFAVSGTSFSRLSATRLKEIDLDFGTTPVYSEVFTIADTDVSASSTVLAMQSGKAAAGRSSDENEMDQIHFTALPGAGILTLRAQTLTGPVVGLYKVAYIILG